MRTALFLAAVVAAGCQKADLPPAVAVPAQEVKPEPAKAPAETVEVKDYWDVYNEFTDNPAKAVVQYRGKELVGAFAVLDIVADGEAYSLATTPFTSSRKPFEKGLYVRFASAAAVADVKRGTTYKLRAVFAKQIGDRVFFDGVRVEP